jgi:hypothetical protein
VLSPNSVASEQVERELTIAAETKRRVIPIVESPCELPDGFQYDLAGIQRIDFSALPRDVALDHLVRRVGAGGPHAPPAGAPVAETPPIETPIEAPPIETPSPVPASPVGAAAGPASVLPPSTAAAPAFEGSKPSTAWPKPSGPSAMSVPAGPSASRPRRRLAAVLLGTGSAAVLAIVLLVVLSGGGGGDDGLAGSEPSGPTTEATSEDQGASGAPDATVRTGEPQGAQPTDEVDEVSPTEVTISPAETLVRQLQAAYNNRDWDTVRSMGATTETDEKLDEVYGNVENATSVVLDEQQNADGTWALTGALLSLDRPEGDRTNNTTNIVCLHWTVDPDAGRASFQSFSGSDGQTDRRQPEWLPEDQFESTAQQYCG